MNYILSIDGGGTKTLAVCADLRGNILGTGISSGSNYHTVGLGEAIAAIKRSSTQAMSIAGIKRSDIHSVCIGLAGAGRETDRSILLPAFIDLSIADKVILKHDAFIALAGATVCNPGVIVIAGTGTMAFGINSSGEQKRSSGWGNILGDEGSAYYIGRNALISACKAYDGRGTETTLLDGIVKLLELNDFNDVVKKIYSASPKEIAGIAPLVSEMAYADDEVAIRIMKDAGIELAISAVSVIKRLGMEGDKAQVATTGSVFNAGEILITPFREYIKSAIPFAEIINPKFKPVIGGLLLALQEIGTEFTNNLMENLKKGEELIENSLHV
jgi:N-acetylglucosamine kinase-like BadF-type ATPase